MRNFTFLYLLLLSAPSAFAQQAAKTWFDKSDSVYGYYVTIAPSSGRIQAALVLLDGYGGNADGVFPETKIQNVAYANDILTVCIPTGPRIYADKTMLELLNKTLTEVAARYQLRKDQFAIGGFSSGGTIALRYAELCHEKPNEYPVIPQAVFDVDSPLDLIGLYKSSEQELEKDYKGWWLGESQMIIDRFKNELGDRHGDLTKYRAVSPFLADEPKAGNEQWLKETAVRTYHDVDVTWQIQNRRRSIYQTNMLNASEFINRLVLQGNNQAEFVASKIEGRRSNGQRHPHSWNIVDEIDLIQWLREKMHFYPDHLKAPYSYQAPSGWQPERILFPLDFATSFPYKGIEDIRFAPGWGNPASPEIWAYTFLWWLDGAYPFTEKTIVHDLNTYYTGLTMDKARADKLDLSTVTPSTSEVKKAVTASGDIATYTATINIFDTEVTKKPGVLFGKIHVKQTKDTGKTIVIFEIAGNPFSAPVWKQLDKINEDFGQAQ